MLAKLLLILIRIYQLTLSKLFLALFGPVCRFEPSCSRYAAACIAGHGAIRGSLLSVKRLSKCHPFHPGGHDPPPPPRNGSSTVSAAPPAADDSQVMKVGAEVIYPIRQGFCLPDDGAIEKPR